MDASTNGKEQTAPMIIDLKRLPQDNMKKEKGQPKRREKNLLQFLQSKI
jgi:hypothetical protein